MGFLRSLSKRYNFLFTNTAINYPAKHPAAFYIHIWEESAAIHAVEKKIEIRANAVMAHHAGHSMVCRHIDKIVFLRGE